MFRNYLIKRIRQLAAPVINIHSLLGLKLLTSLRLGLSHLNEHRFNHHFESCLDPLCTCSLEMESTTHFFLHCHHFNAIRITLNNSLKGIDKDIPKLSDSFLTKAILFGDSKYSDFTKPWYFKFNNYFYHRFKTLTAHFCSVKLPFLFIPK